MEESVKENPFIAFAKALNNGDIKIKDNWFELICEKRGITKTEYITQLAEYKEFFGG